MQRKKIFKVNFEDPNLGVHGLLHVEDTFTIKNHVLGVGDTSNKIDTNPILWYQVYFFVKDQKFQYLGLGVYISKIPSQPLYN